MRPRHIVGLAAAVYVVGLIATAPATLFDSALRQASNGRLRLTQASGTVWSGAGQIELRDEKLQSAVGRKIAWRLRPAHLLLARLRYDVALGVTAKTFPVTVSFSRLELSDATLTLPAAALGLAMPKLAPLELTGEAVLQVTRLSLEGRSTLGNATLQWRNAGSALTPISPLGDYELRVEGVSSRVNVSLHTLKGPLQLSGEGTWTPGSNPALVAQARIPPPQHQQLAPLLRLIAIERNDGSFTLQLK